MTVITGSVCTVRSYFDQSLSSLKIIHIFIEQLATFSPVFVEGKVLPTSNLTHRNFVVGLVPFDISPDHQPIGVDLEPKG